MSSHVPSVTSNPLKLALKLLFNKNPAARSALVMAASGMALSPVDWFLGKFEKHEFPVGDVESPNLVLVCGPPRSGTTLVAQYLINRLEVSYINNLTSLFPRAPVTASKLAGSLAKPRTDSYSAYYGRSRRLSGTNDGLHLWDRWIGADRSSTPESLEPDASTTMPGFFKAWQSLYGTPTVNKTNRLLSCIDLLAPELPNAHFVCLERDPVMLAQSLLIARTEIGGDTKQIYGLRHPNICENDPVEDVCRQVEYYQQITNAHKSASYADRILFLNYEQFCANPESVLQNLVDTVPFEIRTRKEIEPVESFKVSNSVRLPEAEFNRIQGRLGTVSSETN